MASSTQPVAFPTPRGSSERLIWALAGLILVIAATLSAMAAPALAESQRWPFVSSPATEAPRAPVAATASPVASSVPFQPASPSAPALDGTVPTAEELAFVAAVVEASTAVIEPPPATTAVASSPPTALQPAPVATSAATPAATPAPAAATPAPTAVATPPPPLATPVPTPAATPLPVANTTPVPLSAYSERAAGLFLAMNEERVAAGLLPLAASEAATDIAMHRAQDMQSQGYFAHVSPSGEHWLKLVNDAGIPLTAGGENLAKISGDVAHSVEVAITKLMESPTHAANILGVHYERVGVAAVTDERGVTIFVTIFLG